YCSVDLISLSYLPNLGKLPPEGSYAILDLGHQKTNFVIFQDGSLKLARSFSWGGKGLTKLIQKKLKLKEEEEAKNYKHQQAVLKANSQVVVEKAIYESFLELALKIKQTLFSLREEGYGSIDALYLCGGTSELSGVDAFFSEQLSINVSFLDSIEEEVTGVQNLTHARRVSPTALSLALLGAFPAKGHFINFRQGEYAYKRDFQALGSSFKRLGAMAASVVLLGLGYYTLSYFTLSAQVEKANQGIASLVKDSLKSDPPKDNKLKNAKSMLSILNGRIRGVQDKLKTFESGSSLSSFKVLQLISDNMPSREEIKLDIDQLKLTPNQGRLEGRTENFESVAKIKTAMETVKFFKNVQKIKEAKGVRGEIKFILSFDIVVEEASETGDQEAAQS
ncbi:MAG: pilus assembly protein PilM, partial [Deltaproteobacteria bacterium]|nr:pilus assembly protein PilM [Deltaproteobacteria bacterium]